MEHFQKEQIIWNGNGGTTLFVLTEQPYHPPNQEAYMDGDPKGYAAYAVAPDVTTHDATGLTLLALFLYSPEPVLVTNAITAPISPQVTFSNILIGAVGDGAFEHTINGEGPNVSTAVPGSIITSWTATSQLTSYSTPDTQPSFAVARLWIAQAGRDGSLSGKALTEVRKHVDNAEQLAGTSANNRAVIAQLNNAARKSGSPDSAVVQALNALAATFG